MHAPVESVALIALVALPGGMGAAGGFEHVKVADTNSTVPGRDGNFLFLGVPSIDGEGRVVFCGHVDPGGSGLYLADAGGLRVVADRETPIPGQPGNTFAHGFRSYGASIDAGAVAFYAFTQSTELGGGVYLWRDGEVARIADGGTPVPGGTATFNAIEDPLGFGPFSHPAVHGGVVAFRAAADTPRQRGIYAGTEGALRVIADLTTPVPGWTGAFTFLSAEISLEDGKTAFRAEGTGPLRGIYSDLAGVLEKVADTTDPIPGGTGNFTSVEFPWLDGGAVYFVGRGSGGQQGIYLRAGGEVSVVVDLSTPIPGGSGTFTDFEFATSQPSSRGGYVVFRGRGAGGQEGIYIRGPGSLLEVIDRSDILDGKAVASLATGSGSARGGALAYLAGFSDGSSGIYIALPAFCRGDTNSDGGIDVGDAITILLRLFLGRPGGDCPKGSDIDDDGEVDLSDAVSVLGYIFLDRAPPAPPFPGCGVDSTLDDLPCASGETCR